MDTEFDEFQGKKYVNIKRSLQERLDLFFDKNEQDGDSVFADYCFPIYNNILWCIAQSRLQVQVRASMHKRKIT